MRLFILVQILVATLTVMVGCSYPLRITLFNNSRSPMTVQMDRNSIPIDLEKSAEFLYPGPDEGWTLRLHRGACEYVYLVPRELKQLPSVARPTYQMRGGLKVQLEPNLQVLVLPATATTTLPIDSVADLQQFDFPLHPSSTLCR